MSEQRSAAPTSASPGARVDRRWAAWIAAGLVGALLAVYPPLRFVRLASDGKPVGSDAAAGETFDAVWFSAQFWSDRLQPAATQAPALTPLVLAVRADAIAAAKAHGHKVGEGTTWYYFARGSGRVTAVEKSRLLVEPDGAPGAIVAVRTGPVFGNVVRDGCGLLELNRVPGLAEFNAVSAEINRLVEERVQPSLKTGVDVGTRVTFAGCAEAPESVPANGPLLVFIPVQAEVVR